MSSHLRHRHDKLRQEPGKAWRNSISPRGWTILLACLRIDWELLGQSLGMPEAFISFQHEALSHCLETQLERPLSKGRNEINVSTFGLLFSEMVQYCQNRVHTVPELQAKLSELGQQVGSRMLDVLVLREKGLKREVRVLNILLFIKSALWKSLFGKEADKLEQANDDDKTYYIIEKEPLVNKFISVPKDKGSLNCAAFIAGIVEAVLHGCNFPAKVTAHWHKGTTLMIKFDESVITRDKSMDGR